MQHRECVESGLGDAAFRAETEAAIERSLEDALLFEDVGEAPVAHGFGEAIALADGASEPRSHVDAVGYVRFIGIAGVVLAEDERCIWKRRCGDLAVNLRDRTADH